MSWTTTIEGVLADLSPENEECLMSLLKAFSSHRSSSELSLS